MSLVFCDGFDDGLFANKWTTFSNTAIVAGKNGNGLRINGIGPVAKILPAAYEHATMTVGFAIRFTAVPGSGLTDLLQFRSDANTTLHETLSINGFSQLVMQRVGTQSVGPSVNVALNNWYYVEMRVTLSDTVGTLEWRLDGTPMYTATGQDTKGGGIKTVFDTIQFAGTTTLNYTIDDLYICNGAGSTNNTFLGAIAIESLYPDNNGNSSQFVGSDADSVDNYLLVDEAAPSTADYVESATVGEKDTYTFGNLVRTTGNVLAVVPTIYADKSDAAARTARLITRSGSTEGLSDVKNLGIGWNAFSYPYDQDPNGTINWTISSANAAEFGFQVDS
jgi:hypothetical protein